MTLRVAIVGCGLIGRKRAALLGDARLTACADVLIDRAHALAGGRHVLVTADWTEVVQRLGLYWLIVNQDSAEPPSS